MLGSTNKKPNPHRRALLFVDNSGADIVLGMLPLARELLRRGTEVSWGVFDFFANITVACLFFFYFKVLRFVSLHL